MLDLNLTTKTESKPANVEEAINAGWKTAKEMYEAADVCRDTFNQFLSDVRKAMSEKPNSSCRSTPTTEKCITGPHNTKYYHPKVEEAFQLWLKRNAMNAGGQRTEGSIIKQDNQKDLFIGCVATKGSPAEKRSLAQHLMEMADQQELLEQTNQQNQQLQLENQSMRNTLQYDKVKGWYKWSDLKRELAQNFEIFKHRISFKTVSAEAGLVKETDYAERIYGEDCFPTTMISESGIDKIYNCYDR